MVAWQMIHGDGEADASHAARGSLPLRSDRTTRSLRWLGDTRRGNDLDVQVSITVREATADDSAAIAALLAELGYELSPAQVAYELDNQPDTVVLVATADETPAGLAAVNTRRQLHEAAPVSTIDALVVTEGLRSQGIGEALVRAAENLARQRAACMLDLHSGLQRVDARRFYERMGLGVIGNHFIKALQ